MISLLAGARARWDTRFEEVLDASDLILVDRSEGGGAEGVKEVHGHEWIRQETEPELDGPSEDVDVTDVGDGAGRVEVERSVQ